MLIRSIPQDKAIGLLQEWNGQTPEGRATEAERIFRAMCDRYIYVEVESLQELSRLGTMEEYLTGRHGFYLYLRYPSEVLGAVRMGRAKFPEFFHKAEERYSSASGRGSMKLLIGLLREEQDPNYDIGLFIDIIGDHRKQEERARREYRPEPRRESYAPAAEYAPERYESRESYETYDSYAQPEERTNVVHYHFQNQVS